MQEVKPSIIFLNGPDNKEKRALIAALKEKFVDNACVAINRKDLLNMFNAYQAEAQESHEWIVAKVIKSILNNGVFVIFDAFLPARRMQQYVDQMKGLPCYWIGVFFKEHSLDFYDFSVNIKAEPDLESLLQEIPYLEKISAKFEIVADLESETGQNVEDAASDIFNYLESNEPKCFVATKEVEHTARKRVKNFGAQEDQEGYQEGSQGYDDRNQEFREKRFERRDDRESRGSDRRASGRFFGRNEAENEQSSEGFSDRDNVEGRANLKRARAEFGVDIDSISIIEGFIEDSGEKIEDNAGESVKNRSNFDDRLRNGFESTEKLGAILDDSNPQRGQAGRERSERRSEGSRERFRGREGRSSFGGERFRERSDQRRFGARESDSAKKDEVGGSSENLNAGSDNQERGRFDRRGSDRRPGSRFGGGERSGGERRFGDRSGSSRSRDSRSGGFARSSFRDRPEGGRSDFRRSDESSNTIKESSDSGFRSERGRSDRPRSFGGGSRSDSRGGNFGRDSFRNRSEGGRSSNGFERSDRPQRSFSDRPFRERSSEGSFRDRPSREGFSPERLGGSEGRRGSGRSDSRFGNKGGRSFGPRKSFGKPFGDKRPFKKFDDAPKK